MNDVNEWAKNFVYGIINEIKESNKDKTNIEVEDLIIHELSKYGEVKITERGDTDE